MVVRELLARIGVQVDEKSISKADKAISGLKAGLVALGSAYVVKKAFDFVAQGFERISSEADNLGRLSQKTGIAVEQLQALQFAAHMSDIEGGTLEMGLVHLSRAAQEAATQGGAAGAAFFRLGLNVKGADGHLKPTNVLLGELADKFAKMPDGPEKAATAIELFSRSGAELIPLLNGGSDGLARMGIEAKRAGIIMSSGLVKAGQRLDDAMKRTKATIWGLTIAILGPFVDRVAKVTELIGRWVEAHRKLIATRIHEYVDQIGRGLAYILDLAQKYPVAFAGIALALGAAFAPMATLFAGLALLADDVLGYFSGRKSLIGIAIKGIKLLAAEASQAFKAFKEDPFGFLYDAARAFFDWFVDQAKALPDRIKSVAHLPDSSTSLTGFGHFMLDGGGPLARGVGGAGGFLLDGGGPLARLLGGGSSSSTSTTFAPQITVNGAGGDGQGIGSSIVKELDAWWGSKMGAATPAGR